MKKLLSILAAVGLTATATTSVVACGSKKNDAEQKTTIVGAIYDGDKKLVISFNQNLKFNVTPNIVHINNGAQIETASIDANDKMVIDVTLKEKLMPDIDTTYIVTVDGTNALFGNTFVVSGAKEDTAEKDADKVEWKNTTAAIDDNNIASFGISKYGSNVDLSIAPSISYDKDSKGAVADAYWDYGTSNLRIKLRDGLDKKEYKIVVSFSLKNGTYNSEFKELTINKDKATTAESSIKWESTTAIADKNNNQVSWYFKSFGAEVDLSKNPKVEAVYPNGIDAVESSRLDANAKRLIVVLKDGLPNNNIVFRVTFSLKNGFENNHSAELVATKNEATSRETTVNWKSQESTVDGNNSVSWTIKDDGYGKELDLKNPPTVRVLENPNKYDVVKDAKWEKESLTLTITFNDGIKKGDYKFEIDFGFINGFEGKTSYTLTAKKENPTAAEELIEPASEQVDSTSDNGHAPSWDFSNNPVGLDIDITPNDLSNNDQSVIITDIDGTKISGAASSVMVSWDGKTLKFIGGSAPVYSSTGTHKITFSFRLTNGFSGRVEKQLSYVVK